MALTLTYQLTGFTFSLWPNKCCSAVTCAERS